MFILTIVLTLMRIFSINTVQHPTTHNINSASQLIPPYTVSTKQIVTETNKETIKKPLNNKNDKKIKHLNYMLEIEEFFNNISNLPCVLKKRQNIEKATGADPYKLFT
ncbi:hypothetical protein CDIK_4063 [Cucumispora dikerogammari]|nr:hypothetical protein CDIK_4063 [Cucumispora dikerogammari]